MRRLPIGKATSLGFAKQCLPYPAGTMLLEKNPSCDLRACTAGGESSAILLHPPLPFAGVSIVMGEGVPAQ